MTETKRINSPKGLWGLLSLNINRGRMLLVGGKQQSHPTRKKLGQVRIANSGTERRSS